ncbi:MAG: SIMPL domain-containing protein [Pseudomonadota bacterium]
MQNRHINVGLVIAATLIALGIAAGGWFTGNALVKGREADRVVTVKGVAEREVEADLALWPIQFVVADDELKAAQTHIGDNARKVSAFLERHGIDAKQVGLQDLNVTDTQANRYGGQSAARRFVISQTIMVRSTAPETVFLASQKIGELVDEGVVLSSDGPMSGGPTFLFTKLNDVKPAMIAEATASARQAAEQFAKDAHSNLGGIGRANQGLFVILPRDQASGVQEEKQRTKIVRVVTTVDYLLR